MRTRGPVPLLLLTVLAILILMWPLESSVESINAQRHHTNPVATSGGGSIEIGGSESGLYRFLQAAGLNALLADVLWMKADDLWHSASWWQMAPVMEAIVKIDPKFVLVWRVLAWHYAWNLYVAENTDVDRQRRLQQGEDTYLRAVAANPKDYDLYYDMCWYYIHKVRRDDKATKYLEEAVADDRFGEKGIDTIERQLQRLYERDWRVDDAMAVIRDIQRKRPSDAMAKRDLEWWTKYKNDENWRWILEDREDFTRQNRFLPPFLNPFEGKTVRNPFEGKASIGHRITVPAWRDMSQPDYRNPDYVPQIWHFPRASVERMWDRYPNLQKQWADHHEGEATTSPKNTMPYMGPSPDDPMNGPLRRLRNGWTGPEADRYRKIFERNGMLGPGRNGRGAGPMMGPGMRGRGMGPGMGPGMGRPGMMGAPAVGG